MEHQEVPGPDLGAPFVGDLSVESWLCEQHVAIKYAPVLLPSEPLILLRRMTLRR